MKKDNIPTIYCMHEHIYVSFYKVLIGIFNRTVLNSEKKLFYSFSEGVI